MLGLASMLMVRFDMLILRHYLIKLKLKKMRNLDAAV